MRRERLAFAQDGLDSLDVFLMDMTTWLSILWTSLDMGMNIQLFTGYFGVQGTRVLKNTILQHVNVHHQFYMFIYNYIYRYISVIYHDISFHIILYQIYAGWGCNSRSHWSVQIRRIFCPSGCGRNSLLNRLMKVEISEYGKLLRPKFPCYL